MPIEKCAKRPLAFNERKPSLVFATGMQEVECEINQALRAALRQRCLQGREIRSPVRVERYRLAIKNAIGQALCRLGQSTELCGPVETFARAELYLSICHARLEP